MVKPQLDTACRLKPFSPAWVIFACLATVALPHAILYRRLHGAYYYTVATFSAQHGAQNCWTGLLVLTPANYCCAVFEHGTLLVVGRYWAAAQTKNSVDIL